MSDDEAILAALRTTPDAFAELYRRHVDAVLGRLRRHAPQQAEDLCAETFAAALEEGRRFDPARATVAEWLAGIADRELAHLDRRGAVDASARRRLGMAALQPGAGFADALEEELVAAARFLATRRRGPVRLPRLGRPAVIAVAVLAVAAGAAFALTRGGDADDEIGDAPPPPPPNATFSVVAMQRLTRCDRPGSESLARSGDFTGFSVFQRPQRGPDGLPFAPRRLPIGAYDARATRLVAQSRPEAAIRVVPSTKIAVYGRCGTDDGPGACLVAAERSFRCFPISDMRSGRAVARTPEGRLVGMVPDDVGRVTLSVAGPSARADVADNVFEVQLDAIRGTEVELAMQRADGCVRGVAPELLRRIGVLRERDQPTLVLPAAALGALRDGRSTPWSRTARGSGPYPRRRRLLGRPRRAGRTRAVRARHARVRRRRPTGRTRRRELRADPRRPGRGGVAGRRSSPAARRSTASCRTASPPRGSRSTR